MTETPELLTPREVASAFAVDPKTVTRWANDGKLRSIRTPGGHRRFLADDVHRFLAATCSPTPVEDGRPAAELRESAAPEGTLPELPEQARGRRGRR